MNLPVTPLLDRKPQVDACSWRSRVDRWQWKNWPIPAAPTLVSHDGSGEHHCAIRAVGAQGRRTTVSRATKAGGLARLRWDSVPGADAYVVERDGQEISGLLRIEGLQKEWTDKGAR